MSRILKVSYIALSVILILMLIILFTLRYGGPKISSAPVTSASGSGNSITNGNPANLSANAKAADPEENAYPFNSDDFTSNEPATPKKDISLIFQMDISDIHRGNLILINTKNIYDIPEDHGFVDIAEFKTSSYRLADGVFLLSNSVIEPLNDMMDAFYAETGNNSITVISAFRDYQRQQEILDEYIAIVGRKEASKWAATPGYSEHHAGLAVDLGIYSDGVTRTFLRTSVTEWFFQNSAQFGFIPRYSDSKTSITKTAFEPWHFRYVGVPHASFIRQMDFCFEEYIDFISGFTCDEPYTAVYNNAEYEIYFTKDLEIHIPYGCEFDISGNNIDGFIVTIKR